VSLFFKRGPLFPSAGELIAERTQGRRRVSGNAAPMSSSVVWACVRLRANAISTSPVDVYRKVGGRNVLVPTPPVLSAPGGARVDIVEWLYSTQADLDRYGNCFGVITARDGLGYPARIELLPASSVTVRAQGGVPVSFRCDGVSYSPEQIWHEKQYTEAGMAIGLPPVASAALALTTGLSAREFLANWFAGSGIPAAHLKNTAKTLNGTQADEVKRRFNSSVRTGDVFVTGSNWDYEMLGAQASESGFLETIDATDADTCRFMGVPADMVDVNRTTGSITYANITQRNLQLLIHDLGPAATRRERALSTLVPTPRFVKLNTDAVVLRMDPMGRAELNKVLLDSRQRVPSEVREKDDLLPFTAEQLSEMQAVYGRQLATTTPTPGSTP